MSTDETGADQTARMAAVAREVAGPALLMTLLECFVRRPMGDHIAEQLLEKARREKERNT